MIEEHFVYILNISDSIDPATYPPMNDYSVFPYIRTVVRLLLILHYILVLIAFYRKFIKQGAFYMIFFVAGIFDVYHCMNLVFLYILVDCVSGPEYTFPFYFVTCHDAILLVFTIFINGLMMVNRFSATFLSYSQHWTPEKTKIYMLVCFAISFLVMCPVLVRKRTFSIENGKWKSTVDPVLNSVLRWVVTSTLLIYEVAGIILGSLTVNRLRTKIGTRSEKYENGLFAITLVHLVLSIVLISYQLVLTFGWQGTIADVIKFLMSNMAMVAFLVSNSFTIMITNEKVRMEYWDMIRFRKHSSSVQVTTVSSHSTVRILALSKKSLVRRT